MAANTDQTVEKQLAEMRAHIRALESEVETLRGSGRSGPAALVDGNGAMLETTATRRQMLRKGAVVLGATAAVAGLGTKRAAAADGDTLIIGDENNTGSTRTVLFAPVPEALFVLNSSTSGAAILGSNLGTSGSTLGGDFVTQSPNGVGVRGRTLNTTGATGVRGEGSTGVSGVGESIGGDFTGTDAAVVARGSVAAGSDAPSVPGAPLHVKQTGSAEPTELTLLLESTVPPQQIFRNTTSDDAWFFAMTPDNQFKVSKDGTGKVEAKFFDNGNLQIAGTLIQASDVNVKTDMVAADTAAVLDAVARLDLLTWAYEAEPGVSHLGPTAQDFAAAFGLGATDTGIASVDADGVALAAIQGLNTKLMRENERLREETCELNDRLTNEMAELRRLVDAQRASG